MRLVASGSAPLATHVEEFLKTVMCAPVAQGYGLTETCGSSFIALPEAVRNLLRCLSTNSYPHSRMDSSVTFQCRTEADGSAVYEEGRSAFKLVVCKVWAWYQ